MLNGQPVSSRCGATNVLEYILCMQRPQTILNKSSGSQHHINPQQLGNRVILMRAELAKSVSQMVPNEIQKRNVEVLRKHLENSSYISGSSERSRGREKKGYRRGGEGVTRARWERD
jgi:hypothetical protein